MFCYHCQEAKKNIACDTTGICGKSADISSLQDLLVFSLKGLAFYAARAESYDLVGIKTHRFMAKALFSMVTNVNFTGIDFVELIDEVILRRNSLRQQFLDAYQAEHREAFSEALPEQAQYEFNQAEEPALIEQEQTVGVEKDLQWLDPDVHALQECLTYAVKGLGSLAVHNLALGMEDSEQYLFMYRALDATLNKNNTTDDLLIWLLRAGGLSLKAMRMLESSNSAKFGEPQPTTVYRDSWERPGILISGHDLQDIEDLLEQTSGTGIDVYTHGEAISAHAYPALQKYFNLIGNFGGAWQDQKTEFTKFNGPILVTTDSIQQPKKAYQNRVFTTGMVGWPDVPHIADRKPGERKDFSAIIEIAKQSEPPSSLTEGSFTTGYGLQALLKLADPIASAIKNGLIQRIIVIAGTDGRHKERRYYTQIAEALPQNALIITAGDVKYRFMEQDFGWIDETIPRLLDVGQITAFCHIIDLLERLRTKLDIQNLSSLPVSFDLAWYEQKTLLMMLALFALDYRQVRVGPTLPPFFTENILTQLADRYQFKGIGSVEEDVTSLMAGQ